MDDEIIIQRLAIFETKLDNVLTIIPNHDAWIRELQLRKEECIQDTRICKIETRLDDGEKRFDDLEIKVNGHISSQTASNDQQEKQTSRNREWIILFAGIVGGYGIPKLIEIIIS